MRLDNTASVEELQLISRFESLRKMLLTEAYSDHVERPLAFWALPTDRRLPLAFLGRKLGELLNTPFSELSATPGIGRKKIASFVQLLARVANTDPTALPTEILDPQIKIAAVPADGLAETDGFDPTNISEMSWAQWRASVVRHGLSGETLGHFAPSLRNMTRVIWNTPLGAYTSSTLDEIRSLKTHGEKRIRAVLEVFHAAHVIVSGMGKQEHLVVRIFPRQIDLAENWTGRILQRPGVPGRQEIFDNLIQPLLEQIRIDATGQVAMLVENRLGVSGPITSVRQAARTMGLTRARVYQLLNEVNDIMTVRWPMGRHQIHELREKFMTEAAEMDESSDLPDLRQFHAAVELFYPGSRRGASGSLEQTFDQIEQEEDLMEVSSS